MIEQSKHEQFIKKNLEKDVEKAHEQALFAEKSAQLLSSQALGMVPKGETVAIADRPLSRKLHPNSWGGNNIFDDEDVHSMELATNAALRTENVTVRIEEGSPDYELTKHRDKIIINTIDGKSLSEK
ncbi:hypothetical protein GW930_03185 [Candidatus Saccharibacteria bacterium]|nr:hypothetical protein [Candidatus Saccharibacteria bacterium]